MSLLGISPEWGNWMQEKLLEPFALLDLDYEGFDVPGLVPRSTVTLPHRMFFHE